MNHPKNSAKRRVLITGAAGQIGRYFAQSHSDDYDLVLLDLPGRLPSDARSFGSVIEADLRDLDAIKRATVGVDTVIHLAGHRQPASVWRDILEVNIVGTYNVVAAAIAAGARRVIFASSIHAVSGMPEHTQSREDDPPNPDDLYGVSKVFGEALGRYVANHEGISFIALRIGAYQELEVAMAPGASGWLLQDYCAPDDFNDLLRRCVDDEDLTFEIFNAISANRYPRLDMTKARRLLGHVPRYDAFALAPGVAEAIEAAGPPAARPPSGMREDVAPAAQGAEPTRAASPRSLSRLPEDIQPVADDATRITAAAVRRSAHG